MNLYVSALNRLATFRDEEAQSMAEYAVILAVITIGVILAITALAGGIKDALNSVTELLP